MFAGGARAAGRRAVCGVAYGAVFGQGNSDRTAVFASPAKATTFGAHSSTIVGLKCDARTKAAAMQPATTVSLPTRRHPSLMPWRRATPRSLRRPAVALASLALRH